MTARRVALAVGWSDRHARELLEGIREWMRQNGAWRVRIVGSTEVDLVRSLRDWGGDGIIAGVELPCGPEVLRAVQRPVVDVSAGPGSSDFPRVCTDPREVARIAAEHLLGRGLTRLAVVSTAGCAVSAASASAFAEHARNAGHACVSGHEARAGDHGAMVAWMRGLPRPIGLFAGTDRLAQEVLEACQHISARVPEDMAVLGAGDDDVLCELATPPLSSVRQNSRLNGYRAAETLATMMQGGAVPARTEYVAPIGVTERQSTNLLAVADPKIAAALQYIHAHACEGITVRDVLKAVPMSRTLFDRRFTELVGRSAHREIVLRKLDRARRLLIETDAEMAAIAEACAFSCAHYLCTVFRRSVGMSPAAFRRAQRGTRAG